MILRPSKHAHPDRTVLNLALVLLARLKARRVDSFDSLNTVAKKQVPQGDVLFLPAINLLFLLGLVEYQPKTDAFEYRGKNAAV